MGAKVSGSTKFTKNIDALLILMKTIVLDDVGMLEGCDTLENFSLSLEIGDVLSHDTLIYEFDGDDFGLLSVVALVDVGRSPFALYFFVVVEDVTRDRFHLQLRTIH